MTERVQEERRVAEDKEHPCNICGRGWPYHEDVCAYLQTHRERDQALADRDRWAKVAEELAEAIRGWIYNESEPHPPEVDATAALVHYEALRDG